MSDAAVLDRLVPITVFNKGCAAKIFERAAIDGPVIILKNNAPAGVVVSPEEYTRLTELEEDYLLLLEAMERLKSPTSNLTYTQDEILQEFGLTAQDIESANDLVIE